MVSFLLAWTVKPGRHIKVKSFVGGVCNIIGKFECNYVLAGLDVLNYNCELFFGGIVYTVIGQGGNPFRAAVNGVFDLSNCAQSVRYGKY